jgi:single-stranded-DNA-specific exonuclease
MVAPRIDRPWALPASVDSRTITSLARGLRFTETTAEILIRRGIQDVSTAKAFLYPSSSESIDPFQMRGMRETAVRVAQAIGAGERIVIFGDYDADGIPGATLLFTWLSHNRADVYPFIPAREDGYGLTLANATTIINRFAPKVVITVDCGSSDHEAIAFLTSKGIDVIVTDHHLTLKGAPPTKYFLNPARSDGETYPHAMLCGCGVAYKLIQALSSAGEEPALYDLLAISTVGDQVPLLGENRFFVKKALDNLHKEAQGNLGLRALAKVSNLNFQALSAGDLAWRICPRINAVGRMKSDPNDVVRLLYTSDWGEAMSLASTFAKLNVARQELTDRLTNDAIRSIGNSPPDVIVAYLPEVTIGVSGLVAGRIAEYFSRPTLVVNDEGRGSGRSVPGLDLMPFMHQLRSSGVFGVSRKVGGETITPDYGGHHAACGFRGVDVRALQSAARGLRVPEAFKAGTVAVETVSTLAAITDEFLGEMDALSPFGQGFPEPNIGYLGLMVTGITASKDGRHITLTLSDGEFSIRAPWFFAGEWYSALLPLVNKGTLVVDVVGVPSMSHEFYGRGVELQIIINHLRITPAAK